MMYRVTHVIQSTDTTNLPVSIPYYTGESLAHALSAMCTVAVQSDTDWITSLSVHLDMDYKPVIETIIASPDSEREPLFVETPALCDGCAEAAARDCDHVDPFCERHGGAWGSDETCERCCDEEGDAR